MFLWGWLQTGEPLNFKPLRFQYTFFVGNGYFKQWSLALLDFQLPLRLYEHEKAEDPESGDSWTEIKAPNYSPQKYLLLVAWDAELMAC